MGSSYCRGRTYIQLPKLKNKYGVTPFWRRSDLELMRSPLEGPWRRLNKITTPTMERAWNKWMIILIIRVGFLPNSNQNHDPLISR
jgi:hypothetical protein